MAKTKETQVSGQDVDRIINCPKISLATRRGKGILVDEVTTALDQNWLFLEQQRRMISILERQQHENSSMIRSWLRFMDHYIAATTSPHLLPAHTPTRTPRSGRFLDSHERRAIDHPSELDPKMSGGLHHPVC
jgi:hypothetical protein